jgi:hypothetical protein
MEVTYGAEYDLRKKRFISAAPGREERKACRKIGSIHETESD